MPREAIEDAKRDINNVPKEAIEDAKRGTSLFQEETGHFIGKNAYRSCHDINTVKKLPGDVLSQTAQRHARKHKDCRPNE